MASPDDESPSVGDGAVALFAALAEKTRWAIVRELAVHRRDGWHPEGLPFADLRRAVGVSDAGRFNYHLEKLRGGLVFENEGEYVLSNQGLELVGSVLAGAYDTAGPRRETIDEHCTRCGRRVEAIYEFGYLRLECPAHGVFVGEVVPARPARERSINELVSVAGRRSRARIGLAVEGTCAHCWGRVETAVSDDPIRFAGENDRRLDDVLSVSISCTNCGFCHRLPAHVYLVGQPAVVSFRYDNDDDQTGIPYLGTTLERISGEMVDTDRAAATVTFIADEDRLVVSIDDSARVIGTERR